MDKEFVITEDGSHTIYLPEMDEHYHSTHGAIQESLHIYINQGLLHVQQEEISILEIGFGTGLNAYLTYVFAKKRNLKINYLSIEKYPLTETEYLSLNYPMTIFPEYGQSFIELHRAGWNSAVKISPGFSLMKVHADLLTYEFDAQPKFNLVYYDAFAPGKQPEMWAEEIIKKVSSSVQKDGILVTYCAKGAVRRAFATAGFQMERIPGPIGKKEILRGKKTI
jgi:tRNA U34 5-methylaminomethyl-2-thiouridine-forming methyltransferase MnmC